MIIKGFKPRQEEEIRRLIERNERAKRIMSRNIIIKPLKRDQLVAGRVETIEKDGKKQITFNLSPKVLKSTRKEELFYHEIEHVRQHRQEPLWKMKKHKTTARRQRLREMWANTLSEENIKRNRWF